MNINQYYLYKQAEYSHELPILDTVKMEKVPSGGLGEALQKRVEENKKKVDADRRHKLKAALQSVYANRYMYI